MGDRWKSSKTYASRRQRPDARIYESTQTNRTKERSLEEQQVAIEPYRSEGDSVEVQRPEIATSNAPMRGLK